MTTWIMGIKLRSLGSIASAFGTKPSHQTPFFLSSQMNRYQICQADLRMRLAVSSTIQIAAIKIIFLLFFLISVSGTDRVPSCYPILDLKPLLF